MFPFEKINTTDSDRGTGATGPAESGKDAMPATEISDREIFIRNAFHQDPATGCKLLFKRYFNILCSHAVRFVYSKQVAEDIVSEVFCRFWEKKVFEHIHCSYRAYLFTAVRNAALNHLKKEFGKQPADIDVHELSIVQEADCQMNLQADELNQVIEKTIKSLPAKCQSVFLMSRLEGKKNAEIASELNLSLKAIEAHITKALDKLKKVLKQEYL